jgi:hypothetical protein
MPRKKLSTRSRVMKRDVAPLNEIGRDEIVEEVVDHLRPWKNHKSRDTVTSKVNHSIDVLRKLVPIQKKLSDRRLFQENAKKLGKVLSNVEQLLASSQGMFRWFLFNTTPTEFSPVFLLSDKSFEGVISEHHTRAVAFDKELKRLRELCARYIGLHPNYDLAKHLSAEFAYGLMQQISEGEISGTEDKAFRTITTLLYEAVSGEQDADLKRACDVVIKVSYPYLINELGTDKGR